MADFINKLFTSDVIHSLQKRQTLSGALKHRLEVLTASEDEAAIDAGDEDAAVAALCWQRYLLAKRAAWSSYLAAMSDAGLFDGDVRARLISVGDDGFRSALAECFTCHFLTRKLHLTVVGRGEGRGGKVPDFRVAHGDGDINIEVKSPYVEVPRSRTWFGDRSAEVLKPTLDEANKQFGEGRRNVLAVVPFVDFPMLVGRKSYVKAFLGETKVAITIDTATGQPVTEPEWKFMPEGRFLKLWPEPRCTRTGAVLVLREHVVEENQFDVNCSARVEPRWFVINNPHCPVLVPSDIWRDCPQLVREGDSIRWTDGWAVDGSPPPRG